MTVTSFQDLPLAAADRAWDGAAAERRVREWAGAQDGPNAKYRTAHLWYDGEKPDNFSSYKLLIADVIDGTLTAVPRAISAAAGVIDGARGGVDIPSGDHERVRHQLERYYRKLGQSPPWAR
ncbi:MAG TPA: hypothetical protein VHO01_16620 [Jatrophihabitans sp.]|nr:hypothetical protein [Jatrophihabitans sp.]